MKYFRVLLFLMLQSVILLVGCGKRETSRPSAKPAADAPAIEPTHDPNIAPSPEVAGSKPRAVREAKRHPAPIAPIDQVDPIADRLRKEFSELKSKEDVLLHIRTLWKETLSELTNEPLASASENAIAHGVILPREFAKLSPPYEWQDSTEKMIGSLAVMTMLSDVEVSVEFIRQRSDHLPPTRADLVLFQAFDMAIDELGSEKVRTQFESWETLSKAANPLYRLLALRAASLSTSQAASGLSSEDPSYNRVNGVPKLGFYLRFLDESDPIILLEAVRAIATVPTPEARQAIERFQALQLQRGDDALAQAAAAALRTQELITQGSR